MRARARWIVGLVSCWVFLACGGGGPTQRVEHPDQPKGPHAAEQSRQHEHGHAHPHAHGSHPDHGHPRDDHFHKRFEDAEQWATVFEDPARDAWQKPAAVIDALALVPSAKVADLGAGTGYFAVRVARRVPQGVVYAVDVEPDMVRYLGERAAREGLRNLQPLLATASDAKLPEPVDVVLVVDTYHHIGERVGYFSRLAQSLRPGGRLVIIDFTQQSPIGPPAQHRISPERVADELRAAGYAQTAAHDVLPHQYFLVFER
jgi:cyclopropane fatty-acyl-phospholipid synthase-like methyltransferase